MPLRSSILRLAPALLFFVLHGCAADVTPGAVTPPQAASAGALRAAPSFGLYLLALSWAPHFCCTEPGRKKEECSVLAGSYGADHLTLHGLWPNYTDAERATFHRGYPEYCGPYASCRDDPGSPACNPDLRAMIPADMKKYAPGYVTDRYSLADHEWVRHGGCTSLDPATYFTDQLATLAIWPSHDWTPELVRTGAGGWVATADLQQAWQKTAGDDAPEGSVLLGCDRGCRLAEVSICLGHDASNVPTEPVACPAFTATTGSQNTCVTQRCEEVAIAKAGPCD